MSLNYWKHRDAHRETIERKEAEVQAAKRKADFERKAKQGTFPEKLVSDYLMAHHHGKMNLPDCIYDFTPEGNLFAAIHLCVVQNRSKDLRGIAEAVRRVHERTKGEGKAFTVKPANPALAAVVSMPNGGTLDTKAREIQQIFAESGGRQISLRTAGRICAAMGWKSARRGRPRKHPK